MKLNKILKNKQGVAIETAVLFMIVVFFLCTLVTSIALIGSQQIRIDKMLLAQDVEIDQIGEDFLSYVVNAEAEESFSDYISRKYNSVEERLNLYNKYQAICETNGNTISVYAKSDTEKETALLYVDLEIITPTPENGLTEKKVNIKEWRYMLSQTQTE